MMKMMKRVLALLLMLAVCCTLTACKKDEAANTDTVTTTAAAGKPDDVLLTVGGRAVTRADYEGYLATLINYYANYGYDASTDPELAAILQQYALETGIEYAVLDLKLEELGLSLSDEEKAAATAEAKAEWEATLQDGLIYYGITEESTEEDRANTLLTVLAELESMGYTEESYLKDAIAFAGYDKIMAHVTKDVTVSDEDVLNYYNSLVEADKQTYENDAAAYEQTQYMNQMYAMYGMTDYVTEIYYKPAGYRLVTHILLEASEELLTAYTDLQAAYEEQQNTIEEGGEVTGELVTEAEIENARLAILADVQPQVDEINQKLAEGATFAELIPLYSTDPGMMDEAAIAAGYEVHMDSTNWVIPFRDQAFTVSNIGDVTAPVVTDYGVHIIQYVADVPGGPVELTEEMRASFYDSLLSTAQNEKYSVAIAEWVEAAEVVYSDEAKAILGTTEEAAQ